MKNELGFKKRFLAARSTFRNKISAKDNIIPFYKRMIAVPKYSKFFFVTHAVIYVIIKF